VSPLDVLNGFSAAAAPPRGAGSTETISDSASAAGGFASFVTRALHEPGQGEELPASGDEDAEGEGDDLSLLLAMTGAVALPLAFQIEQLPSTPVGPTSQDEIAPPDLGIKSATTLVVVDPSVPEGTASTGPNGISGKRSSTPSDAVEATEVKSAEAATTEASGPIDFPAPPPAPIPEPAGQADVAPEASQQSTIALRGRSASPYTIDTPVTPGATTKSPGSEPEGSVTSEPTTAIEPNLVTGTPSQVPVSTPKAAPVPAHTPASDVTDSGATVGTTDIASTFHLDTTAVDAQTESTSANLQTHATAGVPRTPDAPRATEGRTASSTAAHGVETGGAVAVTTASMPLDQGGQGAAGDDRSSRDANRGGDVTIAADAGRSEAKAAAFVMAPAPGDAAVSPTHASSTSGPLELVSPSAAATDEANVQNIVRAVRMQWTAAGGEATLRLEPEHLGQVTLTVRVERGSVTAHIQAETAEASHWIETHQQDLRNSLREQGLEVKDVVVTTNPDGRREQQERTPQQRRSRPARRDTSETAPTFEVVV
jgi:flagellar hook-length control protein FliK